MENNMVIFEYDKREPQELHRILDNVNLVKAGNYDVGIYAISERAVVHKEGIHVWISDMDSKNTNFIILLGYIIMSHPDWRKSHIKIFITNPQGDLSAMKETLLQRITAGRLPATMANIEIVPVSDDQSFGDVLYRCSGNAGLTIFGFPDEIVRSTPINFFTKFDAIGDVLFVNASMAKEIT
jgi:hypothetical protein